MCIGGAKDENVQSDENVPSLERKRPRFRATSTKMSYIPIKPCQVQGQKRPRFQSVRYENVPDSDQQGRKRPRFQSARTKTSQIPIHLFGFNEIKFDFWENMQINAVKTKICGIMQRMENYAELCGEQEIVRYRTHRT